MFSKLMIVAVGLFANTEARCSGTQQRNARLPSFTPLAPKKVKLERGSLVFEAHSANCGDGDLHMEQGKQIVHDREGRFSCDHRPDEFRMKFTLVKGRNWRSGDEVDENSKVPWCLLDTYPDRFQPGQRSSWEGDDCPNTFGVSKDFVDVYGANTPQQKLKPRGPGHYCIVFTHELGLLEAEGYGENNMAWTCFDLVRGYRGGLDIRNLEYSREKCRD